MSDATILVVDDEANVASTIRAILQLDGYDVVAATSGAEALRILGSREFDVVLTDLRLGDVDGIDIVREVQRSSPETAAVMLTGYASLESAVAALRAGAYDYLMKPSDVEELRATVARAVERRALRKRLVELEEGDRLKTQFLSMASHELRTPLTVISGFVQIAQRRLARTLESDTLPTDARDEARHIADTLAQTHRQTKRLARLVDELLDVSRLQTGRVELRRKELDALALVNDVVERTRVTDPDAQLVVEGPGSPVPIIADEDRLDQVLENLIANARKYSPSGTPIEIAVRTSAGEVEIGVRDHGIGIPSNELARVFDLFYRSNEARTSRPEGLGLGLYISREIVTRLGGSIAVESAVGSGSTFRIRLPLALAQRDGAVTTPGAARRG